MKQSVDCRRIQREIQVHAKTLFEGKRDPQPIAVHSAPNRLHG